MFGSKLAFGVLEEEVCGRSIQSGFVPVLASRDVLPIGTYALICSGDPRQRGMRTKRRRVWARGITAWPNHRDDVGECPGLISVLGCGGPVT